MYEVQIKGHLKFFLFRYNDEENQINSISQEYITQFFACLLLFLAK